MGCNPKILVKSQGFHIAQCRNCHRIGLSYKNLLVGFDVDEFLTFVKAYSKVNFEKNCVKFDRTDQVILNSCHRDIQFTFNREEFHLLLTLLQQAKIMLEANRIIEL